MERVVSKRGGEIMPVTTTIVKRECLEASLFIAFVVGSETILVFYFETNEHRFETSHNYSDGVWVGKGDLCQSMAFP